MANGTVCGRRRFGQLALTSLGTLITPPDKSLSKVTSNPLNTSGSVTLDGSGNGTVKLAPASVAQRWLLTSASVVTSTSVLVPQCKIYIGGQAIDSNFVDGTFTGNLDSTSRVADFPIQHGQAIFAVWSGGDVGAIATLSILGMVET